MSDRHPALKPAMNLARVLFLLLVVAFAWWGLHDRGDELRHGLARTSLTGVLVAATLVLVGLLATSVAWLRLLAGFGHRLPGWDGRAVFFVGQLGKYIPGSVWSVSAHAGLARKYGVPLRCSVGTSMTFLGVNLATAGLLGGSVTLAGSWAPHVPDWLVVLGLVACVVAMAPALVNRLGSFVAGPGESLRLSWVDVAVLVALMGVTWGCYAGAIVALSPDPGWPLLGVAAGAFAVGYTVGVAVVLAPAGVGAREVTMVALMAPSMGVGAATAVALLTRALHTVADLVWALSAWLVVRGRGPAQPVVDTPTRREPASL
ncbi:lysylphosphatidylglycerol synthase domain-containing protein [Nocardioides sp. LS1]|uniref:lysylphosphatidylglycerol synthase domain-containing protein n=1 Tax=Nocardioides sp. LS1 TaxID=1027620 RepID=UPI000F61CE62|nr:lysylphosphatidylglycerol synthase domain-containing protein [Nocardioides sp. LS1]GCD91772.1 membrane protein [Nocardioides sp. LS1]